MGKKGWAVLAALLVMGLDAMAQEHGAAPAAAAGTTVAAAGPTSYLGLALAFALGGAVIGGALGQGKAIAAAVEAMARQPEAAGKIQGAMIIGLALIETLVIYMLLICFVYKGNL